MHPQDLGTEDDLMLVHKPLGVGRAQELSPVVGEECGRTGSPQAVSPGFSSLRPTLSLKSGFGFAETHLVSLPDAQTCCREETNVPQKGCSNVFDVTSKQNRCVICAHRSCEKELLINTSPIRWLVFTHLIWMAWSRLI